MNRSQPAPPDFPVYLFRVPRGPCRLPRLCPSAYLPDKNLPVEIWDSDQWAPIPRLSSIPFQPRPVYSPGPKTFHTPCALILSCYQWILPFGIALQLWSYRWWQSRIGPGLGRIRPSWDPTLWRDSVLPKLCPSGSAQRGRCPGECALRCCWDPFAEFLLLSVPPPRHSQVCYY